MMGLFLLGFCFGLVFCFFVFLFFLRVIINLKQLKITPSKSFGEAFVFKWQPLCNVESSLQDLFHISKWQTLYGSACSGKKNKRQLAQEHLSFRSWPSPGLPEIHGKTLPKGRAHDGLFLGPLQAVHRRERFYFPFFGNVTL